MPRRPARATVGDDDRRGRRRSGRDADVDGVVDAALAVIRPTSGAAMRGLIGAALALAREGGEYTSFRAAYHARFRRRIACDSRETVPATLALCWLAGGDPARAITYGANFGRDADTIATMAGAICGALAGPDGLPPAWIEAATSAMARDQHALAETLAGIARRKARAEVAAWQRTLEL